MSKSNEVVVRVRYVAFWKAYFGPLLLAIAAGVGCYFGIVHIGAGLANEVKSAVSDTRATIQSTNAFVKDAQASMDDNYYDIKATVETVATTAKDSDDLVHDLRASLVGGTDTAGKKRDGLIIEATALLDDARGLIGSLQADASELTNSGNEALKPLAVALNNIAVLTDTLNDQVKAGGAGAQKTSEALTKALNDLDVLLADPDIQTTLANSAKTSGSLAASAESVDIALQPLRKKAALLKVVLEKALGVVKVTIPF